MVIDPLWINKTCSSIQWHAIMSEPKGGRSKAYYQSIYPDPPSKSVTKDIMVKNLWGRNIVLVLGPFHQQLSFIYCICKGFRGLSIADVLVSAGVIVEGSVDQALQGKHYQRGVRCIMLIREALIYSRIKEFLSTCIATEKTENFLQILHSALKESQDKLRSDHNWRRRIKWNCASCLWTYRYKYERLLDFITWNDSFAHSKYLCLSR